MIRKLIERHPIYVSKSYQKAEQLWTGFSKVMIMTPSLSIIHVEEFGNVCREGTRTQGQTGLVIGSCRRYLSVLLLTKSHWTIFTNVNARKQKKPPVILATHGYSPSWVLNED